MSDWSIRIAAIAMAGLLAPLAGCDRAAPPAPGIYLTEGGLGYLVIRAEGEGLKIAEPDYPPDLESTPSLHDARIAADGRGLRLEFESNLMARTNYGEDKGYCGVMKLAPAKGTWGDFDLVGYRDQMLRDPGEKGLSPEPPIRNGFLPSFLHRIEDDRIPLYFGAQRREKDSARAFVLASALLAAHPGDLRVRSLFLEAALKKGDFALFTSRLKEWRGDFLASDDPYLNRIPALADYVLKSKALTEAGRNAYTVIERLPMMAISGAPSTPGEEGRDGLAAWLTGLQAVAQCDDCLYPPTELNPVWMSEHGHSYLGEQILAKTAATAAQFLMIEGRRAEALQLLAAGLCHGKWVSENGILIHRLIGIAMKAVYISRLSTFALNACETEVELKAAADALDRVKGGPREMTFESIRPFIPPPWLFSGFPNKEELDIRFKVVAAKFEILRAAVAARRRLLHDGAYPNLDADFGPWIDGGLPLDPFGDGPLRHFGKAGEYTIYSVGPDGADNHAAITYDPTNGRYSAGDVFTRIPSEREYPFPREGTKARTAEDVRRQYPRGLPSDLFAHTKGRPLGISAGPPARIYSFGPDNDESLVPADIGDHYQVETLYDPTNGLTSNGDLFITLPER